MVAKIKVGETKSLSVKEDKKYSTPSVEDLIPEDELIINPIHNTNLDADFVVTDEVIDNLLRKRTREAQARRHREFETILQLRSRKKKKKDDFGLERVNTLNSQSMVSDGGIQAFSKPNLAGSMDARQIIMHNAHNLADQLMEPDLIDRLDKDQE